MANTYVILTLTTNMDTQHTGDLEHVSNLGQVPPYAPPITHSPTSQEREPQPADAERILVLPGYKQFSSHPFHPLLQLPLLQPVQQSQSQAPARWFPIQSSPIARRLDVRARIIQISPSLEQTKPSKGNARRIIRDMISQSHKRTLWKNA